MAMAGHSLAARLTQRGGFPRFDPGSGAQACRGAAGGPGTCGGRRRGGAARSLSLHRRPAAGPRGDARLPRRPPPSPLPVSGGDAAEGRGAAPPPGRGPGGGGPAAPRRPQPMEPRRGGQRCSPPGGGVPAGGLSARDESRTAAKWHLFAPGGGGSGHPRMRRPQGTRRKAARPARGGRQEVRPGAANATVDAHPSSFKTPFFNAFRRKRGSSNSRHLTASSSRDVNTNATKGHHTALPTKDPNPSGCAASP